MNEIEKKAEELRQSAETAAAEAKAAKEAADAAAVELKAKSEELKTAQTAISNLDTSVKEQAQEIEKLQKKLEGAKSEKLSVKQFICDFIDEHKEEMERKMSENTGRFKFETKAINDITTGLVNPNLSLSLQSDLEISAAKRKRNTFLDLLGVATRTADKLMWVEGTVQDDVDYVDENAENSHKGDASIAEVQRSYGKLQTKLVITTEVGDWYPIFRDWAANEAHQALLKKFNSEVWSGVGADTDASTKKKIYGIKTHSTPWAAVSPIEHANYADVIFNACEQIANEGYNPDVALVSPVVYFQLRNLKDANKNYILDRQTDILCSDNREVRVIKSHELTAREIEVIDLGCVKPYAGNSFEIEGVRDADFDRWKFFFRLCGQNKIKTDWKKGLVYVADADTAKTALTVAP